MPTNLTKRAKAWHFPHGLLREYRKLLVDYAKYLSAIIRQEMITYREDGFNEDGWGRAFISKVMDLSHTAADKIKEVTDKALALGSRINDFNYFQFGRVVKEEYGQSIILPANVTQNTMENWALENTRLIKDISDEMQRKIASKVANALVNPTSDRDLKREIVTEMGIAERRAELIAVDQTQKLNGVLTENRQRSIGVTEYIWRGMLDDRERPEHRRREGNIYKWDDPPSGGHPSIPVRCRCWAQPVMPDLNKVNGVIIID